MIRIRGYIQKRESIGNTGQSCTNPSNDQHGIPIRDQPIGPTGYPIQNIGAPAAVSLFLIPIHQFLYERAKNRMVLVEL